MLKNIFMQLKLPFIKIIFEKRLIGYNEKCYTILKMPIKQKLKV